LGQTQHISQQIQTDPAQSELKRHSKSHIEFKKLNFQGDGLVYEQVHVRVETDAKDRDNVEIDVIQPLQTPASDQDTKETKVDREIANGAIRFSVGPTTSTTATVSASGNKSKETSSSTESKKYHSRITVRRGDGVVSWGFFVDDMYARQKGIDFETVQRALPRVDFTFFGPTDDDLPPPPDHFEVFVASCWSLISAGCESSTSPRRWTRWFNLGHSPAWKWQHPTFPYTPTFVRLSY